MANFVAQVPWIQIVAVILLLAALSMVVVALFDSDDALYWLAAAILTPVVGATLAFFTYSLRWRIREYEWLREAKKKWRPSTMLMTIGLFAFALLLVLLLPFLANASTPLPATVVTVVATATQTPLPTPTVPPMPTKTSLPGPTPDGLPTTGPGVAISLLNLADSSPNQPWLPLFLVVIVAITVSGIGLVADLDFIRQINRVLPRPLCADRARMARVIRREAEILLDAGRKNRHWSASISREMHTQSPDGTRLIDEIWHQAFRRTVPPENLAAGIWEVDTSTEDVKTDRQTKASSALDDATQSWLADEHRPSVEVQIQQMWRTDDGGVRVRLSVLSGESEKQMKEGNKLVHLRLQETRQYELIADAWGWPLELHDADDYRLIQILRKDVPIIEPPVPLALPKVGE